MSFGRPSPFWRGGWPRHSRSWGETSAARFCVSGSQATTTSRPAPAATVARCSQPASPTSSTDPPAPAPVRAPLGRRAPGSCGARCVPLRRSGCCICPRPRTRKRWRRSSGVGSSSRSSAGRPGWRHSAASARSAGSDQAIAPPATNAGGAIFRFPPGFPGREGGDLVGGWRPKERPAAPAGRASPRHR